MLQLRDIPLDESSQGDKNLNFMSYLKKSQYQVSKKLDIKKRLSLKKIASKKVLFLVSKNLV